MPKLDLEQQKKRAKELLRAYNSGDAAALARVQKRGPIKLADAQLVIAREAGFPTWPRMKRDIALARGNDAPGKLERAVRARDIAAVRALLEQRVELWNAREALEVAVEHDDREIARLLLAHGAWPDHAGRHWGRHGGCLHAALLLDRPLGLIEVLLAGGASPGARDRDGRRPLAIAVRVGRPDAVPLLGDFEVTAIDRALGACVLGEWPARADGDLRRSDHQHVCWAVRRGKHAALPALLALGLDPNIPDDDGEPALHLAVAARAPGVVAQLLAAGARVDALDFRDEPALSRAYREPDPALRRALVAPLVRAGAKRPRPRDLAELFEDAADAVVAGDLATLAKLLDREPRLATARSFRPHRCTLLHYVAANGVEGWRQKSPPNAGAVAELLLARGADPDALAMTYGGGPAATPLLLAVTSCHPDDAGVIGDIVNTLVAGGASVNGVDDDREPIQQARPGAPLAALVAAGARVNLQVAAALGMRDRVRAFLLEKPAHDVLGSALCSASFGGHTEIVADLLDAGAPIAFKEGEGMTPLHMAVWVPHLETMRLLIARGAPLDVENDYGGTPLSFLHWVMKNQAKPGRDYAGAEKLLLDATRR